MGTGKRWTLAGAAAVAVAVTVHLTTGGILSQEAQVVRGVRVKQGQLAGLARTTEDGFEYLSFQGIPFAEPPVGDLRFKAPQEAQAWKGELDATKDASMCMQVRDTKFKLRGMLGLNGTFRDLLILLASIPRFIRMFLSVKESEDCLYLNVYSPLKRLPTSDLRPVLVFIHGGGFVRGSSHSAVYGPDYLIERDMVVVTFNYRLGTFGFLATNSSDAPGNAGLKDQNMAMRWVRDNIRSFGGDPNRITIYGESAGAASVHLHILSPASKGLFHAAIMSSSSSLSTYVMTDNPGVHSEMLARSLGAGEDVISDPRLRVRYLQGKDRHQISKSFADCLTEEDSHQIVTKLPFGPVVEYCEDGGEDHFLCERPEDLLREGRYTKVPMVIGLNLHEGTLIHALDSVDEVLEKTNSDVTTFLPKPLYPRMDERDRHAVGEEIQRYYIRPESPNETLPLIDLYGDIMVSHGVHVAIKWHTIHSTPSNPVYVYHFTRDIFGFYKFIYGIRTMKGPGHADELGCVFNIYLLNRNYYPDKKTFDVTTTQMTDIISSFVHARKPTSSKNPSLNIPWPPATPEATHYLDFGENLEIKTDLLRDRMQFWDSVYSQVTRNPVYS